MEQPLVSIIMGAYNEEKTISKCIDSILKQTYTNWEFIICDDCSKDDTFQILREYSKKDHRITVIKNGSNMRLAASLNRCIEVAAGKYIARMDADDESMPDRLETQVRYLNEHPEIDCVGTARIIFDEKGEHGIRKNNENPTKDDLLHSTPFAHPTIMMRSTVYELLKGYTVSEETIRAEDLELWFRFFEHGFKGYNIQKPLYKYRESVEDYSKRTLKAAIQTSKVYWRGYKKIGIKWYKRFVAIKPIISAMVPNKMMYLYHSYK